MYQVSPISGEKNTLSLPVENGWFCLTLRVIGLVGAEALL